jgi:hypothetical protein
MNRALIFGLSLVIGAVGCGKSQPSPKVDLSTLSTQIKVGMTEAEVIKIAGEPNDRRTSKAGKTTLFFRGSGFDVLAVTIETDGTVSRATYFPPPDIELPK